MMGCIRCGKCCVTVGIGLDGIDQTDPHAVDIRRFHELHGFVYQADGQNMVVRARCEAVAMGPDGKAVCAVYDTRPQICRDFKCDRFNVD